MELPGALGSAVCALMESHGCVSLIPDPVRALSDHLLLQQTTMLHT